MADAAPLLVIDRLGPRRGTLFAVLLTFIVAIADYATGYEVRLSILYLLPIAVAAWVAGPVLGVAVAALSVVVWLFSFKSQHFYLTQGYYLWEAAVMFLGFLAFAWLIARLRLALRQADERFSRLIEEVRAAVLVVDERRNEIVYANAEMNRIAGDLIDISPGAFEQQLIRDGESGGHAAVSPQGQEFESRAVKSRHNGRWYLMQSGPIPWGSNPNIKLKVLTDITEQKHAEVFREKHLEIMHQAARLATLAEIATTLAHEINQPLMVIATYTDACQRMLDDPVLQREEISTALQKCRVQAVRASSIIERLREFVRQRQHCPVRCAAKALVAEALDMMRPLLDGSQIVVDATYPAPNPIIVADKLLLVQVLVNLIRNAIDAMQDIEPELRKLTISVSTNEADEAVFTVADRGHGFDNVSVEEIFAPFFTTKANGLGLGLAICRTIAEAHGGRLWASDRPGGGAGFYLAIPAGNLSQ